MIHDKGLVGAADRLARAAPDEWKEFVAAFRDHSGAQDALVVQADFDRVVLLQGQARYVRSLLEFFAQTPRK